MGRQMMGSEYLARMFNEYGITHIFHIEAMLRMAIKEMEELGVEAIMAHSENAAGYMADGYARITGRPGICMCQSIGSANMTGGVEDAYLAGSPVIALTGKKIATHQYRNAYQESDHRLFYEAITKFNAEVTVPEQLPYLMRQCFRSVTTGKPGPAHLDIPNRMGRSVEVASISEDFIIEEQYKNYPAFRFAADEGLVEQAVAAIGKAQRPVLVAGRGARLSNAGDEIYALAKKTDMPIVTTPDGKTVVDEADELWLGICGEYGMDCANRSLKEADLVIFIGTQASDQTTYNWTCPPTGTQVIQIDIEPIELGRNYPNAIGLLGDAKLVVEQLERASMKKQNSAWRTKTAAYLAETCADYEKRISRGGEPIGPERLCAELSKVLPDDAVLVADTGFAAVWTSTMVAMKPSQRYLRAAGSLGWAFPAALGVKCGVPERPVVCFTGDGGFYYHVGEMETAVRYNIPIVIVVNNNGVLKQCAGDIDMIFKNKELSSRHYTFQPVNLAQLANDMGLFSIRVTKPEEIGAAISVALKTGRPALVEVMTTPDASVPPALIPR